MCLFSDDVVIFIFICRRSEAVEMQLKKTPAKKAKTVAEKKKATKSKGEGNSN